MLLMMLMVKKLLVLFIKKKLQGRNQQKFRIEKIIKRKGNKLYIKSKCYNSSFNGCIDKSDILYKRVNIFQNRMNNLVEILMLALIYLIMQQEKTLKILHT